MDIDIKLNNYLKDNLGPAHSGVLSRFYHSMLDRIKYGAPSMLAKLLTLKLSTATLHLVKEFLNNLSIEEQIEYINRSNDRGENILFYCENIELMRAIIKYVHNINICCVNGDNALITVCNYNSSKSVNIEMIELLLDSGIDINVKNKYGFTALIYYCAGYSPTSSNPNNNFENIVELLIRRGADVFSRTLIDTQAFHYVRDETMVSEELLQLLRGEISMRYTKNAANI